MRIESGFIVSLAKRYSLSLEGEEVVEYAIMCLSVIVLYVTVILFHDSL